MTTSDYAACIASLAGAAVLLRDGEGRVLLVEPNHRYGWALPGGTVESDLGETPRQAARRETLEETRPGGRAGGAARGRPGAGRGPPADRGVRVRRRGAGRGQVRGDPAAGGGAPVLAAGRPGGPPRVSPRFAGPPGARRARRTGGRGPAPSSWRTVCRPSPDRPYDRPVRAGSTRSAGNRRTVDARSRRVVRADRGRARPPGSIRIPRIPEGPCSCSCAAG